MKKFILLVLLTTVFSLTSCDKAKKTSKAKYSIETKTTTINWTAYKTSSKTPVKGIFKEVSITKSTSSENPSDVFNGLEFTVPVNSIDTKNVDRDTKIITSFFGTMNDTKVLKGKVNLAKNGKGTIDLTMNGITTALPMTYIISGQLAEINATMDLTNWKAKLAIDALNKACGDLHKGDDGISKTWNEVAIHIVTYLKVD